MKFAEDCDPASPIPEKMKLEELPPSVLRSSSRYTYSL